VRLAGHRDDDVLDHVAAGVLVQRAAQPGGAVQVDHLPHRLAAEGGRILVGGAGQGQGRMGLRQRQDDGLVDGGGRQHLGRRRGIARLGRRSATSSPLSVSITRELRPISWILARSRASRSRKRLRQKGWEIHEPENWWTNIPRRS
jgi:hypothetical protein